MKAVNSTQLGVRRMVSTVKLCKPPVAGMMGLLLVLGGCQGLVNRSSGPGNVQAVNHVIFMVQENRSFDSYFGHLPAYWQANGFPSQPFEGMPVTASNPSFDGKSTVPAFHVATECVQNLSPSWNESHVDWNRTSPTSGTPAMDGFVYTAEVYAQHAPADEAPIYDTAGIRAMGLLRRQRFELLLFHGFQFCHLRRMVLTGHGPDTT
jgi:hypothetical protein